MGKENKKNKKLAKKVGFIFFTFLLVVPLMTFLITFLSPSVAEATNPELGECNISFEGEYFKCFSLKEAFLVNFLMVSIVVGGWIIFHFIEDSNKLKEVKNEN